MIWVMLLARRETDDVVGNAVRACGNSDRLAAEALGQPQRIGDAVAFFFAELQASPGLDRERREGGVQTIGQALCIAHQSGGARVFADADQDALARGPRPRDRARLHLRQQLVVDPFRGAAERQLAQRRQIGGREEVLERALGLLRHVDLALLEPLDQVVGGEIDQLDGIGTIEDGVRHGLAHAHMGDLRDYVVEALDVLDIDRGVDVDTASQELFDVEVALGVAAADHIGMGELVDEGDLGTTGDDGIEIHLLEPLALVFEAAARDDFEALQQRFGLLAAVGFDHADDDVVAVFFSGVRLLQHLVGFADAPAPRRRRSCSLPTRPSSRRAASSRASGEGRWSGSRRGSAITQQVSLPAPVQARPNAPRRVPLPGPGPCSMQARSHAARPARQGRGLRRAR